jgi:hypothetical protein
MEQQSTSAVMQPSAGTNVPPRPVAVSVSSEQVPIDLLRKYSSQKPIAIQQIFRVGKRTSEQLAEKEDSQWGTLASDARKSWMDENPF